MHGCTAFAALAASLAALLLATAAPAAASAGGVGSRARAHDVRWAGSGGMRRHVRGRSPQPSAAAFAARNASQSEGLQARDQYSGTFSGRATYFTPGLGACGGYNNDGDPIVALNAGQYESGDWCNKWITITANGVTQSAQIRDECPGCPWGALDMSPSLFADFAPLGDGVFQMSWTVQGENSQPSSSKKPQPSPTTTTQQQQTTSSHSSSSTHSSSSSSSSTSAKSTSTSSTSTSSSTAASTSTGTAVTPSQNNLLGLDQIVGGFVALAQNGHDGQ